MNDDDDFSGPPSAMSKPSDRAIASGPTAASAFPTGKPVLSSFAHSQQKQKPHLCFHGDTIVHVAEEIAYGRVRDQVDRQLTQSDPCPDVADFVVG